MLLLPLLLHLARCSPRQRCDRPVAAGSAVRGVAPRRAVAAAGPAAQGPCTGKCSSDGLKYGTYRCAPAL
jgi:hypothetical protein